MQQHEAYTATLALLETGRSVPETISQEYIRQRKTGSMSRKVRRAQMVNMDLFLSLFRIHQDVVNGTHPHYAGAVVESRRVIMALRAHRAVAH